MDCSIELILGGKFLIGKLYSMNPVEREELRKFINQNFKRGFIHPYATPILFWGKKDGGLRLCNNYHALNAVSKSNAYPLIKDLLGAAATSKIFSKLDL